MKKKNPIYFYIYFLKKENDFYIFSKLKHKNRTFEFQGELDTYKAVNVKICKFESKYFQKFIKSEIYL